MENKFSYCTLIYDGSEIGMAVEDVARAGYDGIEIYPKDWHYAFENGGTSQFKKLLSDAGICVSAVFGEVLDSDMKNLLDAAHAADTLGCRYVFAVSPISGSMERNQCIEVIANAADVLKPYDLTLVIHNHAGTYMDTIPKTIDLCSEIHADNFGLCFDSVHFALFDDNIEDKLEGLFPFIRYMHLKDMYYTRHEFAACIPVNEWRWGQLEHLAKDYCDIEDGIINNRAIAKNVQKMGYSGWWLPEVERKRFSYAEHANRNFINLNSYF